MLDKTKERATAKKWRAANKEKVRGYNQKAYAKLPEGYQAAQSRKWRAANPEKKATEFEKYKQKHPNWFKKQTTRRTTAIRAADALRSLRDCFRTHTAEATLFRSLS